MMQQKNTKKLWNSLFCLQAKTGILDICGLNAYSRRSSLCIYLESEAKIIQQKNFFDVCDRYNAGHGTGITIKDCTPSRNHNRTTINEKASVCSGILQIHNAKYLKIGMKDKISQYVDFSYAYGADVTLGFQKNGKGSSFPITLIPKSINTFTTKSYRILFVLTKTNKTKTIRNSSFQRL